MHTYSYTHRKAVDVGREYFRRRLHATYSHPLHLHFFPLTVSLPLPLIPHLSLYLYLFFYLFFLFFFPLSVAASMPTKGTSSTLNGFENLTTDSSGKNVHKFVLTHYTHDTKKALLMKLIQWLIRLKIMYDTFLILNSDICCTFITYVCSTQIKYVIYIIDLLIFYYYNNCIRIVSGTHPRVRSCSFLGTESETEHAAKKVHLSTNSPPSNDHIEVRDTSPNSRNSLSVRSSHDSGNVSF